jgi:HEAT repeat protein
LGWTAPPGAAPSPADTVPQLVKLLRDGDKPEQVRAAREALEEGLTRITAETLTAKLQDPDPEVRRAAASACASKESKIHIPELLVLLDDAEPEVANAAHRALKSLTGQDFGPPADATPEQRTTAVIQWYAWWKKQAKER